MVWARWRRTTVGTSCKFCLMLASRGAVYTSEDVAKYGYAGSRYHDHCDCGAELVTDPTDADAVRIDPVDANRILQLRVKGRDYVYDLSNYRNLGVTDPPKAKRIARVAADKADDAGGWEPGKWLEVTDPVEANQLAAGGGTPRDRLAKLLYQRNSRRRSADPPRAYRNGNKTVMVEPKLTQSQIRELLDDFDFALSALPPRARREAVELIVPSGDKMFAGSNAAGGYVISGGRRIHLAPAIAKGRQWPRSNGWHGPYAEMVTTKRGTMTHEMGHVLDNINGHTRDQYDLAARKFHRENVVPLEGEFQYAHKNAQEGYAEMFAQWVIGGPGSHPVADAYARKYGWSQ